MRLLIFSGYHDILTNARAKWLCERYRAEHGELPPIGIPTRSTASSLGSRFLLKGAQAVEVLARRCAPVSPA